MPDMWMDVDTALSEVPVNKVALIDDTDFKTREEAVAYNATGLELIWHFTTTAGATSATVVTPTTGGVYDWAHQDGGLYTIEIPASGGASINNDTEGFGFFSGKADGVLPWVGPTIGFRAAAINNALIDGGDVLDVNLAQIGGVEQSATDLKDFADTGYDPTSHKVAGVVLVDTTTTNTDMRGTDSALLATSAPANFGDLAITASTGLVTVGTNNDKTGYSLTAGTGLGNQTADITGSLSGSVGSVLGGINTSAGTITTLDGLDTAQDTQHSTTQSAISGLNNLSASDIRTAVGLATANLDTQLGEIVTDTGTTIPGFLASIIGDTNELQTDWANGGRLDLLIDGIKTVTDAIPDSGAMTSIAQEATVDALSFSTFDVSSDTVITASIYTARVDLTIDGANSQDEYTVQWLKNGAPVAVTGTPQIQVVKRADGTDLVAATNMTQIGSVNGAYKYDEGTNRITAGEAVLITCTATIDAVTRTWTVPLARDSS